MSSLSRTSIKSRLFVGSLVLLMFVAPAIRAQVLVEDAWVRATVRGQQATGAFMRISTKMDVKLVEARTTTAGFIETHQMLIAQGVMSMRPVKGLLIRAGEPVEFKSGGYHLMLMDIWVISFFLLVNFISKVNYFSVGCMLHCRHSIGHNLYICSVFCCLAEQS